MPELPEVECWGRRVAEAHCAGRTITKVHAPADTILFEGTTARKFAAALKGKTIEACHRKGKQMWWTLSREGNEAGPHPLWHFGMTGRFEAYRETKDRPRFLKVELLLDDGTRFGFRDARRFGRIRLLDDPLSQPPLCNLGPDPLLEPPTLNWFREQLGKRKAPVKAVLLDQGFLAGVGNWIADEVLYQAHIDPHRRCTELSDDEIKTIRTVTLRVIRQACKWEADYTRFSTKWLFHHRWGKNEAAKTYDGKEIDFSVVGGRTTAWVPAVQV